MPTYTWKCPHCDNVFEQVMGIGQYSRGEYTVPECLHHLVPMERYIEVVPTLAIHNPGAGDRHYDGLRATDGTMIDSRTKHREYMAARGLTLADDFKETWKKAQENRDAFFKGQKRDPELREAIAKKVYKEDANA